MYSEDDEPQELDAIERLRPSWPPLKLYEDLEATALSRAKEKHKDKPQDKGWNSDSDVVLWRTHRFLEVLKGFHTGSLDLTGRHQWRYDHYFLRWTSYLKDFLAVAEHTIVIERRSTFSHPQKEQYVVTRPEVLRAFEAKWRSPDWDFYLYPLTKEVFGVVLASPEAKLQRLLIIHLPTEMLHRIFMFASRSQATLLGSTCRRLRAISFEHIHKRLCLGFGLEHAGVPEARDRNLDEVAKHDKYLFMKRTDALLSRDDIRQKTRYLQILDRWYSYRHSLAGGLQVLRFSNDNLYGVDINSGFYTPIMTKVAIVITSCLNLTELCLSHVILSQGVLEAVVSLPRLHTVKLEGCNMGPDLRRLPIMFSPSETIVNLSLHHNILPRDNYWYWVFLSICPRVRNIGASGVAPCGYFDIPPSRQLRALYSPWGTLEQLSMENLHSVDISALALWIEEAKADFPLRLSHFKLRVQLPLEKNDLYRLIAALDGAPLQVLALSSIRYAGTDLISRIAAAFTNLIGLTLVHRYQFVAQDDHRLYMWPHASWEYAPGLRGFKRLEHLGMNYYCPTIVDHLEDGLDFLGRGAFERMETGETYDWYPDLRTRENELDNATVARVFAVHCPSLKTFTLQGLRRMYPTFDISRRSDGSPVVTAELIRIDGEIIRGDIRGPASQRWFPFADSSDSYRDWPTVLPGNLHHSVS
ncbi:hypothetical protein OE88DRAFT_33157 [Heliocybe sulcata]|uniref:F-box domain-containing protein n=1 Tax=Heliocybe sulcata TaxID=5364 RepID=A0A5C3NS64_9AGAM|nr:hypothetical protein OE88DRAFT_33157 [Heliocybe sulcata]